MLKYKLYIYEVFGNAEDGYEVNDVHFVEDIELSEDASFSDVLKAVDAASYIEIDQNSLSPNYYFVDSRDGKPVGELRGVSAC